MKETHNINKLSSRTFVFLEHLNFPLGTSKTVMWWGFGWRSWCESQSKAGSCFLPGELASVSCFLAGTGSGGVNRGNPTCWRGNSTVPSYTHPAGTLETTSCRFLSPPQTHDIHTHAYTHGWIATHLSTDVQAQSPSCPQFETMDFCEASGRNKNLIRICSLKIFALFHSVTSADIHFPSFVLQCTAWSVIIYVCACCDGLWSFDKGC